VIKNASVTLSQVADVDLCDVVTQSDEKGVQLGQRSSSIGVIQEAQEFGQVVRSLPDSLHDRTLHSMVLEYA
jgi:hypothetical protein